MDAGSISTALAQAQVFLLISLSSHDSPAYAFNRIRTNHSRLNICTNSSSATRSPQLFRRFP